MITPAEIEALAREACRQMGLDPDEMAFVGWSGETKVEWPRWKTMAYEAELAIAMDRAIHKLGGLDDIPRVV